LVANHTVYEVSENARARTLGDLLDFEGMVEKVSIVSTEDGSPIFDFDREASKTFIEELLPLAHVDFDTLYAKVEHTGDEDRLFLRAHLKDGTSFRMVYYPAANLINPSAMGTDRLKEIVISQMNKAGLAVKSGISNDEPTSIPVPIQEL
jgi:hypothetical protein